MPTIWDRAFAHRTQRMQASSIRELFRITNQLDVISFGGGMPAHELFPSEQIASITQHIMANNAQRALQYSNSEGYPPLREYLAEQLRQQGVSASPENILIVSGSQQGLDLLSKVLLDPGDRLLVESPTYMGALQVFAPYEPTYVSLPTDNEGIDIARGEALLQTQAKALYIQPTFQNPTGVTLSLERRHALLALTGRAELPVIEDDPYSQLRFEGDTLPSLLALEHERQQQQAETSYQGQVIQVNTFSKIIAPGLRVGWIVGPAPVIRKLVLAKQGADLHTATLPQMITYELLHAGFLEEHLPRLRILYRQRRDAMLTALSEHFPSSVRWTHPHGGLFLWVTLPDDMDTIAVLQQIQTHRVAFIPGAAFHPNGGGTNTLRLSFSNVTPERIEEGIKRLGTALHSRVAHA